MTDIKLFMNLIRHHLGHSSCDALPDKGMDANAIEQLISLAGRHDLTAMVGTVLLENNLISSEAQRLHIQESVCEAACYYEIMNHEVQWLNDILEQAKIPHILLKGAVIRKYYPNPWERTSGDIDILIPEDKLDEAVHLLCQYGCQRQKERRYHDVPLITPGNNLLELHFSIQEDIPILDEVLDRVWEYSTPVSGKRYEYLQSQEFLLFHLLAHMSYHLIHGGCGIRSFIDIQLLHQNEKFNHNILQRLLSEAQLTDFYSHVLALNGVWFEGNAHNEVTPLLQELVVEGETFGSRDKEILMEQALSGSRAKYVFHRIFMPYRLLKKQYPILEKHPVLLPCCQFLRWIRILTDNRNTAIREMQTSHSHSGAQIQKTQQIIRQIGIDF